MFICWLEKSLILFLICVEFSSLKVCGMLSINRIFRLGWEFLKSAAGRLFVSDNCFVLDLGGFSVWLMLIPCGNGWFVFWSVDDTDLWSDDEWIWFDWLVVEECKIWFSVCDWQDTDLVGCFMNCKMSIPNVFAEKILHLRHLKNCSALLALMYLFILVISFLFIHEHCGWTHGPHLLQLIQSILFCFRLLVFLIIQESVSG